VFLSTDAGGVGLNLQNASTVVNMDLPWNPAVLNQRIGRVHRLGQHQPVRVVNFVAQGTIEHSMLSVLSFKQSVFAGVLDGGRDEVFLGGTRLKRFMDSVDKVTQSIPASMPPQAESTDPVPEKALEEEAAASAAPTQPDWAELLSAGLSFLDKLGRASSARAETPSEARPRVQVETDASTGQQHLKVPVPSKEVLRGIANFLNEVAGKL
jgi:superfamily II DNA/RNA helicase